MNELAPSSFRLSPLSDREDVEVLLKPATIEEEGHTLRDYWRVIRKHLWLIAACIFGTVLATALVIFMMTPIYTAETTLLIERQAPRVLNIREVLSESLGPDELVVDFYKTQYEILKSRALAAWVIREQGLETNGLFTEEGFVARLWGKAKGWAGQFFLQPPKTVEEHALEVNPKSVEAYFTMLDIKPIRQTRLIKIAFSTPDAALSARVANAHAQDYIRHGLSLRTRANEEAQHFLEEKLAELKGRVEQSEAALNRYRRHSKVISLTDKENIVVERLADLNRRVSEAEAERIALESRFRLIRKRDYDSLPAVIDSALIQRLKEQLAPLETEYAKLSTLYKPGHRPLDQLKAQLEELRRRLRQEMQRVVAGIESSYLAAGARERALRAEMEKQKAATLAQKDASVKYAILAREVDTNRQLYDSVLQRMKEMGVAAELRASNVSVIDKAEPPHTPSRPKKLQSLLLSALVALIGGVSLAFLLEYLDNTLKTPQEVERYLRLPNLGVVPDFLSLDEQSYAPQKLSSLWRSLVRHRKLRDEQKYAPHRIPSLRPQIPSSLASGRELALVLSHPPLSVVTEAYRMLRMAILLSQAEESPKTILFTSGIFGEGKTVTVVNTAIVFAQMGVRVLVIDADLRRPDCHRALGVENGLGLTEILTGQRGPIEVIRPTATNHLFLLSAGSLPPNPAELVGSKKMQETVAALREQYDYILIDSPPVMQVSDAVLLSTIVDGVVLVVSSQATPKYVAREARSRLSYARAKILGVTLNRVDLRSGDSAYYHRLYHAQYRTVGL
ncbi:MAG: GumC family protein [Candidatus Entotheonellia bacterium]